MLEVVEDQQHMQFAQPPIELVQQRLVGGVAQPDCARDGGQNGFARADGGEVDEEDTVLEPLGRIVGGAERQSRLSDATWPRQREQADGLIVQTFLNLLQLRSSTDEPGRLCWKLALPQRECKERREADGKSGVDELEHALGVA